MVLFKHVICDCCKMRHFINWKDQAELRLTFPVNAYVFELLPMLPLY